MREHGTHACYTHGPEKGSVKGGCRCEPCKAGHAAYEAKRAEKRKAGISAYVPADEARAHVLWLGTEHNVGLKTIAKVTGVSQGALWKLMYGKKKPDGTQTPSKQIRRLTAVKILSVTPDDGADGSLVPNGRTLIHIDKLLRRGWSKAAISRAIGQDGRALQLGRGEQVTRRNARAVEALLDQPVPDVGRALWLVPEEAELTAAQREKDRVLLGLVELLEERIDNRWWAELRACQFKDPGMFFPAKGDSAAVAAAKTVCNGCAVRQECLDANLHRKVGIYGGTSERQRRKIRKDRGIEDEPVEEDEAA